MSAETLRRAASLMRERAEEATPGPWSEVGDGELMGCFAVVAGGEDEFNIAPAVIPINAEHIASWHPVVALAVADWLTGVAADVDKRDNPKRVGGRFEALAIPDERAALAVARAYLGADA